jgi:hypothetical protein
VRESLLELAEEPGLSLPAEPKLWISHEAGMSIVTYGRLAWVHRLRLAVDGVGPAVERVAAVLGDRGLPEATWWVGELTTPAGLAGDLLERGLEADDPAEMTSLTIGDRPGGEPTVEVRRVESLEDALQAFELDWEVFEVPEAERAKRRAEAVDAWPRLRADTRQTTYLAYLGGEPVGFGRAVFTPAAAVLLGGATLPAARGQGVYTSLVHARWDDTAARGVPRIVVAAGPMSAPILARLGFSEIGRVRLLRQRL